MTRDSSNAADTTLRPKPAMSFYGRVRRALGPVLPGLVLDLADFFSLTRTVGPWVSFPIGFAIGSWMSLFYPFAFGWRLLIATASGLYTLTPGTEYIPLATILACLGRFIESTPEAVSPMSSTSPQTNSDAPASSHASSAANELRDPVRTGAACPECGATSLQYGEVAQRFWPAGSGTWAKGHAMNAFVCLECGFVGHYLASAELDKLRARGG